MTQSLPLLTNPTRMGSTQSLGTLRRPLPTANNICALCATCRLTVGIAKGMPMLCNGHKKPTGVSVGLLWVYPCGTLSPIIILKSQSVKFFRVTLQDYSPRRYWAQGEYAGDCRRSRQMRSIRVFYTHGLLVLHSKKTYRNFTSTLSLSPCNSGTRECLL